MSEKMSMSREQIIQDIIAKLQQTLKTSTDQVLLKTVQRFLHIIEMKQFRNSLQGKAQQQGYNSEDDILASFS